MSVSSSLEIGI